MKYKTSEGLEFDDLSVAIRTELECINERRYELGHHLLRWGEMVRVYLCSYEVSVQIYDADQEALQWEGIRVSWQLSHAALDAWYDLRGSDADATRWEACRAAVRGEVVTMEQLAILLGLAGAKPS